MNDVAWLELFGGAVKRQLLEACQLLVNSNDSMTAVVAIANRDPFGVEEDECSVEGGESRGVCECWSFEERTKNCFQSGGVGGSFSRVDMAFSRSFWLYK